MIETLGEFETNSFDQQFLLEVQPAFDCDVLTCSATELTLWFQNFLRLSQQNIGLAHCVQQHQTARNCLSFAGVAYQSPYHKSIGCFSTNHDIDTIELVNDRLNGNKYWITAADRADFAVIKVGGHYTDQTRQLVFVDLHDPAVSIGNNGFEPIGMTIASPMTLTATNVKVAPEHILHTGNFAVEDQANVVQSFAKYAFLTNYLGCAVSLYQTAAMCDTHNLDYALRSESNQLSVLYRLWEDNIESMSRATILDQRFWATYDGMYNTAKQIIMRLLNIMLAINNTRMYNRNTATAQQFLDAVVWLSHGRSPFQQVMSDA